MLLAEREGEHVFATLTTWPSHPTAATSGSCEPVIPTAARARGVELIEGAGGPALGLVPGLGWAGGRGASPGASLVLFTDGLFEGRIGPGSQRLGEDGLVDIARDLAGLPSAVFVDALMHGPKRRRAARRLADDVAVVHLRWKAPAWPASPDRPTIQTPVPAGQPRVSAAC